MQCIKPVRITKNLNPSKYPDGLLVPCLKCIACRIKKRKEWSTRVLHEISTTDNKAMFITLTYNEQYVPIGKYGWPSLRKNDLQKFFKRLRKSIQKTDIKIKYFACGEYGDETQRPHYHAIIIGIDLKDIKLIKDNWTLGFVSCGSADPERIDYVTAYIDKKLSGELADEEFGHKDREPVFRLMSNGLGKNYVQENEQQLLDNKSITVFGKMVSFPRYYINELKLQNTDFNKEIAIANDIQNVYKLTGVKLTSDEYYKTQKADDIKKLEEAKKRQYKQSEKNVNARLVMKKLRKKNKL